MSWRKYDPNPCGGGVSDCAVRAVAKATGQSWSDAYLALTEYGYQMCDLISANRVWGAYLSDHGFIRGNMPDGIPTLRAFCKAFPRGVYVVALPMHVVTVVDGNYWDSWDSGNEEPLYYWRRT